MVFVEISIVWCVGAILTLLFIFATRNMAGCHSGARSLLNQKPEVFLLLWPAFWYGFFAEFFGAVFGGKKG